MANSDVDNWPDWKRNDFADQLHRSKSEITRNYKPDANYYNSSTCKEKIENPSLNGFIRPHRRSSNTQSFSDVRFVNPAIYVESFKSEDQTHDSHAVNQVNAIDLNPEIPKTTCNTRIQGDCGDSNRVHNLISQLSMKDVPSINAVSCAGDQNPPATYRCHSINSSVTCSSVESSGVSSVISSRRAAPTERRCKIDDSYTGGRDGSYSARQCEPVVQRFTTVNGHRVVQMRAAATSCTSISKQTERGPELGRKVAHDEWVRKKEQAAQEKKKSEELAEKSKQAEIERVTREREEREWRERENFLRWSERKKREDEEKRATIDKEIALQKRLKEVEDKAEVAKSLCLRQWCHKKKEEQKARQKKTELEQKKIDEDRKKRYEDSTKAYEKWREVSKNKPKPATQGLLPHQKAKPAFINPIPWQSIVEDTETDNQEEERWNRKSKTSYPKTYNGRSSKHWG